MTPTLRDASRRDRLLETGAQAIAAKGFNACGLAEILRLAGVPKGSFYHYFDSKEDFGVALIERESAEFFETLRPVLDDRSRSPLARLRAVMEEGRSECLAKGPERQCLIPRLALEVAQLSEPVRAAVQTAYERWTHLLAGVLREAQEVGQIAPEPDPQRLAKVLVMLWEGATLRMQIDRSLQPVDDFLAFVFDSLLAERS